ncbi:hypothetical protein GCM10007063_06640 [Lentibacillus kapialis]|uniref:DUF3397 domain-containing protein n=1 Tax=Lentibacillus kapialis TaxID=340214 RepID=A0A917UUQ2_9BACI|nr:DUF3397 domain-containing protein [Lentibacillus kapialis]GGJ86787.1 hypothetical protein GCM10007063_06640 [Lentibacillus kapialis]
MIWNLIAYFIGFFITLPVLATVIVYVIGRKASRQNQKAVHTAVNWTTLLYIIAVIAMFKTIFGNSYFGIILLIMLMLFAIIVVIQWKVYTEIVFKKVLKVFWRICFLLFLLLYCLLTLTGIILRIF